MALIARIAEALGLQTTGKLAEALGIQTPPPPVPELSEPARTRLTEGESLRATAVGLFEQLHDPMSALHAACQLSGVMPSATHRIPKRFELHVAAIVPVLKADQRAAMLATSLCMQYKEALMELDRLDEALRSGQLWELNLERCKGKFFYLTRMRFSLEAYPALAQLFPSPAASPKKQGPTAPFGPIPTAPLLNRTGMTKPLPKLQPTPEQKRMQVVMEGQRLVKSMQVKMLILQASLDEALGRPPSTESLLPLPAKHTAKSLAGLLAAENSLRERVEQALARYREARQLLRRNDVGDHDRLRQTLTALSSLSYELAGHDLLARLFPVS